jgi:hypothetical protein
VLVLSEAVLVLDKCRKLSRNTPQLHRFKPLVFDLKTSPALRFPKIEHEHEHEHENENENENENEGGLIPLKRLSFSTTASRRKELPTISI